MKKNVLLVEDNINIANLLEIHLSDLDCDLTRTTNGLEGLDLARNQNFVLIILDIMLPGMDGIEICKTLRQENNYTPILMLSAKAESYDKSSGLKYGADAYITKPFRITEFISKTKELLCTKANPCPQAALKNANQPDLTFDQLTISPTNQSIKLDGKAISLNHKEFDLLYFLAQHRKDAFSKRQLFKNVWGVFDRSYEYILNTYINRLRSKIEPDPTKPSFIKSTQEGEVYFDFDH